MGMRAVLICLSLVACSGPEEAPPPQCVDNECVASDDLDGDGFKMGDDCNDQDAATHPTADEVCDGIDNDCSGSADDGASDAKVWYADGDGDGFGAGEAIMACDAPDGAVAEAGDCNDTSSAVHPGAPETSCSDPVDYNCDGSVGFADGDGDGAAACMDCNDADPNRKPGLTDVCDGIDNNCDNDVDNGAPNQGAIAGGQLYASIQLAVDAAADGDVVAICPGAYTGEVRVTGKAITLTSTTLDATDVVLMPAQDKLATVVLLDAPAKTTTLSKLTFEPGVPQINAVVASNHRLIVDGCIFDGNRSASADGGAIRAFAAMSQLSLRILSSTFIDNHGSGTGGAVSVYSAKGGAQVVITDSTFTSNIAEHPGIGSYAHRGGAISYDGVYALNQAADALHITNTTFTGNRVDGDSLYNRGGAVAGWFYGAMNVTDSVFVGNDADGGGGISAMPMGSSTGGGITVTLLRTQLDQNTAATGSAVDVAAGATFATLSLDTCTITRNTASTGSAGVHVTHAQNGYSRFYSVATMWGEGTTDNMPIDLISKCGAVDDVTMDISCP